MLAELPFSNRVVTIDVTGGDLRRAIENGLAQWPNTVGRFPQVSGMTIEADMKRPPFNRITAIKFAGEPLDDAKTYRVATNDFLARGSDGYTVFRDAPRLLPDDDSPLLANEVMNYLKALGTVRTGVEGAACAALPRRRGGSCNEVKLLLRGLQIRRGPRAQLLEQRRLVGLGGGEVAHLDVAEAADFFRDRRDADGKMMVVGVELRQHLVERRLVVGDQLALGAPLGAVAERVEGGAAQEFEPRQQPEHRHHPRPETDLARQRRSPCRAAPAAAAQDGTRSAAVAVELGRDLPQERAVGVEPRDLVLVLVGHQLEQVARDRLGEPAFAGRLGRLGRLRLLDPAAIARGIGGVLVGGEELDAARDRLVEALREPARVSSMSSALGATSASTAAGSAAARRPQRNAAWFMATASPLSAIACSIASAESGSAPS